MSSSINLETPAAVMVQSMARAGWGELGGNEWHGVRSTLQAISARIKGKRGYVNTTVWQVSQSAGLSTRWTARCLGILEGLGIIAWTRGTIKDGNPTAGLIQIVKPVLLRYVREAWSKGAAAWQERRAATRARLAMLKRRYQQRRSSDRVELNTPFNSNLARRASGAGGALNTEPVSVPPVWATGKEATMSENESLLCDHGYISESGNCPHCHRIQDSRKNETARKPWTKERRKAWRNAQARRNMEALEKITEAERRRESERFYAECPCPEGVDPAKWNGLAYLKSIGAVKA